LQAGVREGKGEEGIRVRDNTKGAFGKRPFEQRTSPASEAFSFDVTKFVLPSVFSLPRTKKTKLETVQWKKPRK